MRRKIIAISLLALFTSACAQQTAYMISEPVGAQVIVDGEMIGVTPCQYDYSLSPGESYDVKVVKEGFQPVNFVVKTDEVDTEARNKWLAAGVVWSPLWLGTLFTKKLKDSYDFILREEAPNMTARADESNMVETSF